MSLTIGRAGRDSTTLEADDAQWNRRSLTLSGWLNGSTTSEVNATRDQIANLNDMGAELAVPVTFDEDAAVDGFYRVDNSEAAHIPAGDEAMFGWSAQLERLGGPGEVDHQAIAIGTTLRNDHGLDESTAQPWHATPVGADSYDADGSPLTTIIRTGADGAVTVHVGSLAGRFPRWHHVPAQHYLGAATLTVDGAVRNGSWCPDMPADWELANSLIRVGPGTNGRLSVATHDGDETWTAVKTYTLAVDAVEVAAWEHVAVLAVGPEFAAVRLTGTQSLARLTLDLSVRRGSRFILGYLTRTAGEAALSIKRTATEAGTVFTGGVRATANDAAGNRYVLAALVDSTADTTQGGLSVTSDQFDFLLGAEVGGSGAQSGDTAADLVAQWVGWVNITERPRRR